MVLAAVGASFILVAGILAAPLLAPAGSMLASAKAGLHGAFWFLLKVVLYLYLFMWLRFTFPRYRFDQLMRLGWQISDSAFDRECDGHWPGARAAPAIRMEPLDGVSADDDSDTRGGRDAGVGRREER